MKSIVALYNDTATANQVVNEINQYGIDQSDTSVVASDQGSDMGDLHSMLINEGVPEQEAELYAEGVRQGGTLVSVHASDEQTDDIVDIMSRHNPIDVHDQSATWPQSASSMDRSTADASAKMRADQERSQASTQQRAKQQTSQNRGAAQSMQGNAGANRKSNQMTEDQGETRIPVVEEEVQIGKRQVERGGVRVHTHIEEQPVEQQVRLRDEDVHVERRPVNRPADQGDFNTFEERDFVVTETDEEPVVQKQARVVEEVVVKKDARERTETVRDTARKTRVDVDENAQGQTSRAMRFDPTAFRNDYQSKYTNSGYTFDQYEPAYRYGYTLANDERYRGRDWSAIEADARRDWNQQNKGSSWENFKDAIRYSWERAKDAVA
ncbi:MAG: YsnF/AvaK domain-containing protein [Caldilineaceae bacterium]